MPVRGRARWLQRRRPIAVDHVDQQTAEWTTDTALFIGARV